MYFFGTPNLFCLPAVGNWELRSGAMESGIHLSVLKDESNLRFEPWTELMVPDWLPVLTFVTLAVTPWAHKLRWRFSLRALLIAVTLLSVLLGLVVWSMS